MVFKEGDAVVVQMKDSLGWDYCPAGIIKAVDDKGIRLALIEFLSGTITDRELYVPYVNIESAYLGEKWRSSDDGTFHFGELQNRLGEAAKRARKLNRKSK